MVTNISEFHYSFFSFTTNNRRNFLYNLQMLIKTLLLLLLVVALKKMLYGDSVGKLLVKLMS